MFDFNNRLSGVNPSTVSREEEAALLQDEFYRWQAFDQLVPLDRTRRIEMMLARVCAQLFNVNRGKDQTSDKPQKYIPEYDGYSSEKMKPFIDTPNSSSSIDRLFLAFGGNPSEIDKE